jgi:hypothetical protein
MQNFKNFWNFWTCFNFLTLFNFFQQIRIVMSIWWRHLRKCCSYVINQQSVGAHRYFGTPAEHLSNHAKFQKFLKFLNLFQFFNFIHFFQHIRIVLSIWWRGLRKCCNYVINQQSVGAHRFFGTPEDRLLNGNRAKFQKFLKFLNLFQFFNFIQYFSTNKDRAVNLMASSEKVL